MRPSVRLDRRRLDRIGLRPLVLAFVLALGAGQALADGPRSESKVLGSITAQAGESYDSLDSVNGGISIQRGASVRSAETVNGGISIAEGANVGSAETVNGGISIAGKVRLGSAETVNGGISVDDDGEVSGGLETVNGAIRIGARSVVAADAETVNGGIRLDGGAVRGMLRTVNGDITLARGSEAGGIEVEEPNRGWWNWGAEKLPRIVIGPQAKVNGPMVFKREVKLYVHATATIGEVRGATAVRYEGENAPE
ncbi:MAG: hypothetical protein ACRC2H_11280 [Silanimonas sp.]